MDEGAVVGEKVRGGLYHFVMTLMGILYLLSGRPGLPALGDFRGQGDDHRNRGVFRRAYENLRT